MASIFARAKARFAKAPVDLVTWDEELKRERDRREEEIARQEVAAKQVPLRTQVLKAAVRERDAPAPPTAAKAYNLRARAGTQKK